jgi:MEDS: MEthanogen/methylotroph, DcmR Sensory domain/Histidine kinase-like ATPase domain
MADGTLAARPHDHVVNIYSAESDLVDDVSYFLAGGLAADEIVVVIATVAHQEAFTRRLSELGVDLAAVYAAGRYRFLTAEEALATFTVDHALCNDRFVEVIGGVIAEAASGGRRVRAYGEMVAVLWDAGNVPAAIELESMWNELARTHRFSLYCAYPAESLTGVGDLNGVQKVCAHHSSVVGPATYGRADTASGAPIGPGQDMGHLVECAELYVPVAMAVRAARHFATSRLTAWGLESIIDDTALVVSELAANAVEHAKSAFRLSITRDDRTLRIGVEDLSPEQPQLDRSCTGPGGRGILLVDSLCSRWGADVGAHGKCVWAEIALDADQPQR